MANPIPAPFREVPDGQILDAANDFLTAFSALAQSLPGGGVLYGALHCGAIAIELFLKAWTAEQVEVPHDDGLGAMVFARAVDKGHALVARFNSAPVQFREAFGRECQSSEILRDLGEPVPVLERFEGLFAASRYPFEPAHDIRRYSVEQVAACIDALARATEKTKGVVFARI